MEMYPYTLIPSKNGKNSWIYHGNCHIFLLKNSSKKACSKFITAVGNKPHFGII